MVLESHLSASELLARWDERTAPARFAGCDDVMDDIYIAKRDANRVCLIRKGRGTWDPFATVFRGKIVSSEHGSSLVGSFGKRYLDYMILLLFFALDVYFAYRGYLMEGFTFSVAAWTVGVAILLGLLAVPLPSTRKKYITFMKEITGERL